MATVTDPLSIVFAESKILQKPLQSTLKRAMDVVLAVFLIILILPTVIVLSLLIKLHDGGPVFYRRRVVGQKGEFDAFKFRTMRTDGNKILEANPELAKQFEKNFKLDNDPRVTKVGRVLRKLSLDELPQLLNVLKGDMSLIGPRMITTPELQKYGEFQDLLLTVKPGMSGYWQVNGRQCVDYEKRVEMDMYYIRNWGLLLDLQILAQTPIAMISGRGAS